MTTFIISLIALVVGYFTYGRFIEKTFGIDEAAETPATRLNDGVDFMPMPAWRIYMIQFLNIAGLGPIFGAIMGALYGPVAFIWIVFGCIFAGAVHDYFSGMLSIRHDGESIPEVVGHYLGNGFKQFMRAFSVILLLLVGVVFILGPAKIITGMTGEFITWGAFETNDFWLLIIFGYYIAATVLPIDKIIGKIYPLFGAVLLIMAFGLLGALIVNNAPIPNITFTTLHNFHAKAATQPIYPMLFITIACGAVSGFHATQSPMMARCITNERLGRRIFYGAMITEGIVALIWAAAAISFFGGTLELNNAMAEQGSSAAWAVKEICGSWMGKVGGLLAILGVVACPITSGDTAFRSARLIIADFTNLDQKPVRSRLFISLPLFAVAWLVTRLDFSVIWRYFGFSNQTLATIVLWMSAVYMARHKKNHWIATLPAAFMTAVCSTYILIAPEGFGLSTAIAYPAGLIATAVAVVLFFKKGIPAKGS
ncbi:carbon starvation CstA family protein [Pontiella sulfatireligans]|uniref:Carbon starvation protein A n=1 Tax=Pontiella sulfatireligans TaxID=2750658 RepID=A0A6C2UMI9_9BACT|nr:carbon starvation protein A [Pontiella sulfatireligans]VGO20491.1 Carbon starvation protein A [Pontiella sulfatireligans]